MTDTPAPIDRIEDLQIEQELQDSYLTYAMSTIMDRALPDVRDGLKPSQRRILVAMRDLNLGPRTKHLKCAKIAGNTSGDYHPHGEAIVYPTLVRLGQDWVMRYPLIDPQGNFGSSDGDPPAAMRYTEARPTAVEAEMLQDLELDTVDYQPNYDDRLQEPTVLPSKFPNLLVNGSTGIAVGMACNLLPHNLREICDEIPYGVIRRGILESIGDAVKRDQIKDIADANDHSGRLHKCRIVVDLKRDADPNVVINQLYQYTPCQITVSMINIALVNRQPRTMGLKELIEHFIEHRKEVITRRTRHLLKKAQQRGHILEGLIFAVCDIDEVIKLIRASRTRDEAIEQLRRRAFR